MPKKEKSSLKSSVNKLLKLIIIAIIISFLVSIARDIYKLLSFNSDIDVAQSEIVELKEEKIELERKLRYLSSDGYKEIQIRDKLGLSKTGEIVIVLPDEDTLRRLSPRSRLPESSYQSKSNWELWLDVFF